jgi:hypothetical protein
MSIRFALCPVVWIALLAAGIAPARAADDDPFAAPVLGVRPRIFLRDDDRFEGLTVARLRANLDTPEFAGKLTGSGPFASTCSAVPPAAVTRIRIRVALSWRRLASNWRLTVAPPAMTTRLIC